MVEILSLAYSEVLFWYYEVANVDEPARFYSHLPSPESKSCFLPPNNLSDEGFTATQSIKDQSCTKCQILFISFKPFDVSNPSLMCPSLTVPAISSQSCLYPPRFWFCPSSPHVSRGEAASWFCRQHREMRNRLVWSVELNSGLSCSARYPKGSSVNQRGSV